MLAASRLLRGGVLLVLPAYLGSHLISSKSRPDGTQALTTLFSDGVVMQWLC